MNNGYIVPMGLLRQESQRIYPDTVTITPPVITKDSRGGEVVTYNAGSAVSVKCMLTEASKQSYRMFSETPKPGSLFTLRLQYAVAVTEDSKIVVSGTEYLLATPSPANSYDVSETFYLISK